MTTRRHSIYDASALGADLAIERGGEVLTYTASASINRMCRALYGQSTGRWQCEWIVWGSMASIANVVSLGVARGAASLSTYVGGDTDSYGYRLAEGQIHTAGASVQSVTAGDKGQVVGMVLDFANASAPTVSWYLDGVPLHTLTLPDVGPWFIGTTISGSTGYDLRALLVTGQRLLRYPVAGISGWFGVRQSAGVLRFADRGYITGGADEPAHAVFRGIVRGDSRLSLRRGLLEFWPMRSSGRSASSGGGARLRVTSDTTTRPLVRQGLRDAYVRLRWMPDNGAIIDAIQVGEGVVDGVSAEDDAAIDISIGDALTADVQQALPMRQVPPDADPTAADTWWPIVWGSARSVTPKLIGVEGNLTYAIHDGPISGLGAVRDGGYPMDPIGDPLAVPTPIPPDYTVDAQGLLHLAREPFYALTADVQANGDTYETPGAVEILAGVGDPFTGTPGSAPTGWTAGVAGSSPVDPASYIGGGQVTFPQQGATSWPYITATGVTLVAGVTYRIRAQIVSTSPPPEFAPTAWFLFCRTADDSTAFFSVEINHYSSGVGVAAFTYTPTVNHSLTLFYRAHQEVGGAVVISGVTATEMPVTALVEDDDAVPMQLAPFLQDVFDRAGWTPASYDITSASDIDTATSYAGIGMTLTESASVDDVLRPVLDTYCAALYTDRAGVRRLARLRKPEDATPTGTLTAARLQRNLEVSPYRAEGYTTQGECRRNWTQLVEGQMSTDTLDVPLDLREKLKAKHRISTSTATPIAPGYSHARHAPPQSFLFDKRADLQAELDRLADYHSVDRWIVKAQVAWTPDEFEFDQVWLVESIWFEALRPMQLIGIDDDPLRDEMTLTFLG